MIRQSYSGAHISRGSEPAGHSNLQFYNQVIPPSGTMAFDSGNFFFLIASGATVNLQIQYETGSTEIMSTLPVGSQLKRVKTWRRCQLTGTPGATFQAWHGYQFNRQDETNFQGVIASITGIVTVGAATTNSSLSSADISVASLGHDATIIANPSRRALWIQSNSGNTGAAGVYLRVIPASSGGALGIELAPGQGIWFGAGTIVPTVLFTIYNPAGVAQKYMYNDFS